MFIKISHNKLYKVLLYIVCSILTAIILQNLDKNIDVWAKQFSIIIIIFLIVHCFSLWWLDVEIISTFGMISVMSFLFQFGNTICLALGYNKILILNRINYYANNLAYINASNIAFVSIVCFTAGGLIFHINKEVKNKEKTIQNIQFLEFLGVGLFFVSFPFYVYTLYHTFTNIVSSGTYTVLLEEGLPGYITSVGKFIYIGLFTLMIVYSEKKYQLKYRVCFCVFMFLICITMMSGVRSEPMTIFIAFLIIYNYWIKSIKIGRNFFLYFLLGIIGLNFLYAIQISRNAGFDVRNIVDLFLNGSGEILMKELEEFGTTVLSTMSVTNRVSDHHPWYFLMKEIDALLPISFDPQYSIVGSVATGVRELGTSFIGEMYYYFGNACYLAVFLIGVFITKIESWVKGQNSEYIFLMFTMWMWQQLNCIRASFNLAIKTILYSFVLFWGLKIMFSILKKRRF